MMKKPLIVWNRRCLAVDPGQSRIKVILAEGRSSGMEVLHALTIDLQEEGLLNAEEANRHLRRILVDLGNYPVAMALPQQIAPSHLISLPEEGRARWKKLAREETEKLTGLSEGSLVHSHLRLKPFGQHGHPIWVSVSRESDVLEQLGRVGLDSGITEVTNVANALTAAFVATQPPLPRVALVDFGGVSTTVVILDQMQPVYATSLPLGGERLSEVLAARLNISFEEAENLKTTTFLLGGKERDESFVAALEQWRGEVERILLDWIKDQAEDGSAPFPVRLCGGGSLLPGLLPFLNAVSDFPFDSWEDKLRGVDPNCHAVAYGTALAGVKKTTMAPSLLPRPLRAVKRRWKQVGILNTVAAVLLLLLFILIWRDVSAQETDLDGKNRQLEELERARAGLAEVEDMLRSREAEYRRALPFVRRQKRTGDLLSTLHLLREVRSGHEVWLVSLADARSYFDGKIIEPRPVSRQTGAEAPSGRILPDTSPPDEDLEEEATPRARGYVFEIAVLDEGRETHVTLRNVVAALHGAGLFRNVDTLPQMERRQLADPELTLPGRTFALHLEPFSGPARLADGPGSPPPAEADGTP